MALQLVDTDRKLSLSDVLSLKHSYRMLLADRVRDDLVAAVRASQPTSEVGRAIDAIARWDKTVADKAPPAMRNRVGIAIAKKAYRSYCDLQSVPRWQALVRAGARTQRLLWASTGTKDPAAPDTLYIEALAAPATESAAGSEEVSPSGTTA